MPTIDAGAGCVLNGLVALMLSLVVWKLTGSFVGWATLFTPGTGLIFVGLYRVLSEAPDEPD